MLFSRTIGIILLSAYRFIFLDFLEGRKMKPSVLDILRHDMALKPKCLSKFKFDFGLDFNALTI